VKLGNHRANDGDEAIYTATANRDGDSRTSTKLNAISKALPFVSDLRGDIDGRGHVEALLDETDWWKLQVGAA
jgi:hypothetical protein